MKLFAWTSKCPSTWPQGQLEETFVQNVTIFSFPFEILSKIFRTFVEVFSAGCQKPVRCVQKNILKKIFYPWLSYKHSLFAYSASGHRSFVETFLGKFSKIPSTCPKEHMEKLSFSKQIFHSICDDEQTLSVILPKFFRRDCRKCILCVWKKISR